MEHGGYEELPNWPFQILQNQLQKCQKTLKGEKTTNDATFSFY